jgi:hypothetical protein
MADKLSIGPTVPGWMFWAGTIALFLIIAAIIWFAIPGVDARHRFISPSGKIVLDIGERCGEGGCARVIVSEETAANGSKTRFGCTVPLTEPRPVLLNVHPLWTDDETAVDIVYADADGAGGKFTLVLARDCTIAG